MWVHGQHLVRVGEYRTACGITITGAGSWHGFVDPAEIKCARCAWVAVRDGLEVVEECTK